jgi:hypothetical protein
MTFPKRLPNRRASTTFSFECTRDIIDPSEIFRARCEARGLLYSAGEIDLHEAVDVLQAAAVNSGLVRRISQDAVQRIMSDAFTVVRL